MNNALLVLQIIISILLIGVVLVQTKGTGFGRVWGTSHSSFTRRGLERVVFRATFLLAFIFIFISILALLG